MFQVKNVSAQFLGKDFPASEEMPGFMGLMLGIAGRGMESRAPSIFKGIKLKPELVPAALLIQVYPGLKQKEYAHMLQMDVTTFGRYADKLEREGVLARERSLDDRRAMVLRLTEEGERIAEVAKARLRSFDQRVAEILGDIDITEFQRVLGVVSNWLVTAR